MYNITLSAPIWRRGLSTLAATALLLAGFTTQAQVNYNPASTAEQSASGSNTVVAAENTGAEAAPLAGELLRVSCWDGNTPSFAWDYNQGAGTGKAVLLGNSSGTVTDPDIVVDPSGTGRILITYLRGGNVYYEVRAYDASTNTISNLTFTPVLVNAVGATCSNPNVDISIDGEAVITYAQGVNIFARAYNIVSLPITTYPISRITNQVSYTFSEPDVAIYKVPSSNVKQVSVVYLGDGPSGRTVNVRQASIANVRAGTQYTGGVSPLLTIFIGSGNTEAPRIAAPVDYGPNTSFSQLDYEVVVNDLAPTGNAIWGINKYQNGAPTATLLNDTDNLNLLAVNEKPVVTYVGDEIIVTWTLVDGGSVPPTRNGTREVLSRQLGWNGIPRNSGMPVYSIVNQQESDDQYLPSLGGRYSTSVVAGLSDGYDEAFYAFYNGAKEDVFYKSAYYGAYNLRGVATTSATPTMQQTKASRTTGKLELYPNPFHGTVTIHLPLAADEQAQALEVYSLTGQRAAALDVRSLASGALGELTWNAEAAGLKPGLYLLRLTTNHGSQNFRLRYE